MDPEYEETEEDQAPDASDRQHDSDEDNRYDNEEDRERVQVDDGEVEEGEAQKDRDEHCGQNHHREITDVRSSKMVDANKTEEVEEEEDEEEERSTVAGEGEKESHLQTDYLIQPLTEQVGTGMDGQMGPPARDEGGKEGLTAVGEGERSNGRDEGRSTLDERTAAVEGEKNSGVEGTERKTEKKTKVVRDHWIEERGSATQHSTSTESETISSPRTKVDIEALKHQFSQHPSESTSKAPLKPVEVVGSKGHLKEIKEKFDRTTSNASTSPKVTSSIRDTNGASLVDGTPPPEEKRRLKAQEWMQNIKKSAEHESGSPASSLGGSAKRPPVDVVDGTTKTSGGTGLQRVTSWRIREEQMKKEAEQRLTNQAQLEERRRKAEEQRRAARKQASSQSRDHDETTELGENKPDKANGSVSSVNIHYGSRYSSERESFSYSPAVSRSSPPSSRPAIIDRPDEETKKLYIESRLSSFNVDNLDHDGLEKKAKELIEEVRHLLGETYDMKTALERKDVEKSTNIVLIDTVAAAFKVQRLNELRQKVDGKGKFVKPLLKKVTKPDDDWRHSPSRDDRPHDVIDVHTTTMKQHPQHEYGLRNGTFCENDDKNHQEATPLNEMSSSIDNRREISVDEYHGHHDDREEVEDE